MKSLLILLVGFIGLHLSAVAAEKALKAPMALQTQTMKYQYDALNRVTNIVYGKSLQRTNGYREVFAYDKVGNLTLHNVFGPPEILPVEDQTVLAGKRTLIPFEVRHFVVPMITNIVVLARPDNSALFETNALSIQGTGTNRVVVVNPKAGSAGETLVSLVASDGFLYYTNIFKLSVKAPKP